MEEGIPPGSKVASNDSDTEWMATAANQDVSITTSTRAAYQRVVWYDFINLWLTYDVTDIEWTYNGETVSSGSVSRYYDKRTETGWQYLSGGKSGSLASDHSYYRGDTWSSFKNSTFCWPLPTVYTYYYYNRVWGHRDGHATRSQSSDSVDECLPFHFQVYSAYGHWSGQI
jgi:hypothetical protein